MKLSRTPYIILLIVINIAVDQVSKAIVRDNIQGATLTTRAEEIQLIDDGFILTNVENEGAFLGMGSELKEPLKTILLLILPVIVLGLVVLYIFREKHMDKLSLTAFTFIIGGGIANVFDRIAFGKVTDFLHIDLGGIFRTGIFNLADLSVTSGMIMLLLASFLNRKKQKA